MEATKEIVCAEIILVLKLHIWFVMVFRTVLTLAMNLDVKGAILAQIFTVTCQIGALTKARFATKNMTAISKRTSAIAWLCLRMISLTQM